MKRVALAALSLAIGCVAVPKLAVKDSYELNRAGCRIGVIADCDSGIKQLETI